MNDHGSGYLALSACGGELRAGSEVALGCPGEERVWTDLCFEAGQPTDAEIPGLGSGRLETSRARRDRVEVVCEVFRPDRQPDGAACRLRQINRTAADLNVSRLSPVVIGAGGLSLAGAPAGDWVYLRAPRKKNDMPACVRLGGDGPGICDAVRGTPETGGLPDAQRSGSDVKSIWPEPPAGEESEGYGAFAIKQNALRYWMNQLWDNDPDALMVRRRPTPARDERLSLGLLNEDEALTCALNQYLGGGLVCFTENLAEIDDDRLFLLRHCAPSVGAAALPRDTAKPPRFPALFDTAVTPAAPRLDPWHTVGVVNWHDEPHAFQLTLDDRLLGAFAGTAGAFLVSAFSAGWHCVVASGDTIEVGPVSPHGCEVIKVQVNRPDAPQLVRTDGHFSMGGAELSGWSPTDAGIEVQVEWPWPVPLRLWLRPPAGRAFAGLAPDALAELVCDGPVEGLERLLRYE